VCKGLNTGPFSLSCGLFFLFSLTFHRNFFQHLISPSLAPAGLPFLSFVLRSHSRQFCSTCEPVSASHHYSTVTFLKSRGGFELVTRPRVLPPWYSLPYLSYLRRRVVLLSSSVRVFPTLRGLRPASTSFSLLFPYNPPVFSLTFAHAPRFARDLFFDFFFLCLDRPALPIPSVSVPFFFFSVSLGKQPSVPFLD